APGGRRSAVVVVEAVVQNRLHICRAATKWYGRRAAMPGWQHILIVAMAPSLGILASTAGHDLFRITVVDAETGRGVPLVELTTTNKLTYVTDSAGVVAFDEPGLMNQIVFFSIKSHGYQYPKDGFGYSGVALNVAGGHSATIKLRRVNVAERLYRVTGQGIYRDSVVLGDKPPIDEPLLNGQVMGQDTVQVIPYRGKLYWFWGDTDRPQYALGNFAVSGASSRLPQRGGLNPEVGINLRYFVNENGFSKRMCPIEGPGPVWIDGLMTLKDDGMTERLVAKYERMKSLSDPYERGLAMFNDEREIFEPIRRFELTAPLYPHSHPFLAKIGAERYFYFPAPVPDVRVKANLKDIKNPSAYESFTCLVSGSRYDEKEPALDRDGKGRLIWAWKADTAPVDYAKQQDLIKRGLIKSEEAWLHLQDAETGETVLTHSGSVFYNAYRKRWVMIAQQQWGSPSFLGEVWFAEADTILGPWVYARKIVTHDDYSFYNVTQHPFFDAEGGRRIYFEGTYTAAFSGTTAKTPRYDYNQIMYALSLDDPRLVLPVPVYEVKDSSEKTEYLTGESISARKAWECVQSMGFFAVPPHRHREGLVPVVSLPGDAPTTPSVILKTVPSADIRDSGQVVFLALPPDAAPNLPTSVPLFEYRQAATGKRFYSTQADLSMRDTKRVDKPVCYVWRNPTGALYLDNETAPADKD
ncbi:MAG: hypothetical protein ACE5HE_02385, partial [Phycisphaerae bacterium]